MNTLGNCRFLGSLILVSAALGGGCGTGPQGMPDPFLAPGPQGPQGDFGPAGQQGDAGPQGQAGKDGVDGKDGADGKMRIFGNGAKGSLTVAANTQVILGIDVATDFNYQFTDITVEGNGSLFVPAGSVVRCTGQVVNDGLVAIGTFNNGGPASVSNMGSTSAAIGFAGAGISGVPAGPGQISDAAHSSFGGLRPPGLYSYVAGNVLDPGMRGGGGGGGALSITGGSGGGTIVLLAMGPITNSATGQFWASGQSGSWGGGGGAGGIIVLASMNSITNDGTINCAGSKGGNSSLYSGPGGGGGGGIVHLVAPSIVPGTTEVSGGAAGIAGTAGSVTQNPHCGGGAGGACGGDGGFGGGVDTNKSPVPGFDGTSGHVFSTISDPTTLF